MSAALPAADIRRSTDIDQIIAIVARRHPHAQGAGLLARMVERQRIASTIRAEADVLDYCLITLHDAKGEPECGVLASVPSARSGDKFSAMGPAPMFFGFLFGFPGQDAFNRVMQELVALGRERGRDRLIGPFETTINYSSGLLAEEPAFPPGTLMPRNPLEWNGYLADFGFTLAEKLQTYEIDMDGTGFQPIGLRAAGELGLELREIIVPYSAEERVAIREVFNAGWRNNWGFVPLDAGWVDGMMREFRPLLWPGLQCLVYREGRPVGVALATPDLEELFRGKPGPAAQLARLWRFFVRRRVRAIRIFILGMAEEIQGTAAAASVVEMMIEHGKAAARRYGARYLQVGWTLSSNHRINRMIRHWAPDALCDVHGLWTLNLAAGERGTG